jgi:precorrin-3B C17-methyltransferase
LSAPLHLVGLGPGAGGLLTPDAAAALDASEVIAGYGAYLDLLPGLRSSGRRIISTGMGGEIKRVRLAVDCALGGEETSLVCSGDPGIYALAGLVLELLELRNLSAPDLPLHIVPGVPALCAAAALLGAPLCHDFACVSLSDLLTPLERILLRLECALRGDFVVVLHNPRSGRRTEPWEKALDIARSLREPACPIGIVRNAFRSGQRVRIAPLAELEGGEVDMFTLVVIGNSESRILPVRGADGEASADWEKGARMLTPRGYMRKYG